MDVDFVILWVDGNDQHWQQQKSKFTPAENMDAGVNRYRDLENLHYWFRGVESFAPWVRKIHFVTWGHLPKWLNVNNTKLNIVNHSDFIPEEYLPTFNTNPIELNLHRIEKLSDKFVYFNDDMFIIKPVKKSDFFKNNLPCDIAALDAIGPTELFSYILTNNVKVINKNFDKKKVINENKSKWFNLKYGRNLYRTFALLPWQKFTGFYNQHLSIAFQKETFEEVWHEEYRILDSTCKNKFRSTSDVSAWLFRYWRLAKGQFYPKRASGKYYNISDEEECHEVCKRLLEQKQKLICINDSFKDEDLQSIKDQMNDSLKTIFPDKSSFEL